MPAPRMAAERDLDVGARVVLLQVVSTVSLSDSTAEIMNSAAERAPAREDAPRCSRMCSTLAVKSKVSAGTRACSAARRPSARAPGPLRKSGSPKVMCVAPAATCRRMSSSTTSGGHDEEAPAVDRRDRAVATQVQAAAAGLDVAGRRRAARCAPVSRTSPAAAGGRGRAAGSASRARCGRARAGRAAARRGRGRSVPPRAPRPGRPGAPRTRRRCSSRRRARAGSRRSGRRTGRRSRCGRRVDLRGRARRPRRPRRRAVCIGTEMATRRARRDLRRVEALDGDVQRGGGEPARGGTHRPGDGERLVAQLVAGDEQDGPVISHGA